MNHQRLLLLLLSLLCCSCTIRITQAINGDVNFGYISTADVSKYLKLASDIGSMRTAPNIDVKKNIYMNGNHSSISLSSLSLTSNATFGNVPMYNIYLSAFEKLGVNNEKDTFGQFDGHPVQEYANTLVDDLFLLNIPLIEGTGAVVFNVMMAIWGNLWNMLEGCRTNDKTAMHTSLDTAVALWVGEGQVRNDNQKGYFIYSLAENAGERFGQDNGETQVNTEAIETFLGLQADINKDLCANDPETGYEIMRNRVQLIIELSNVILAQMLLHHIQDVVDNNQSSDFVELYSLAMIPQIAACDTNLYNTMIDVTVARNITADTKDQAINTLQQSFSCLGITCVDVGSYLDGRIPTCTVDDTDEVLIAGYQSTFNVRDISYIDRDVRQIRLLIEQGKWNAAYDYYQYGWNAEFALQDIVLDSEEWTGSSDMVLFQNYYDTYGIDQYAGFGDTLITNAFEKTGPFESATDEVRTGAILGAIESMILYLGTLGRLEEAIQYCENDNTDSSIINWNAAAAIFVGSMEGQVIGGSDDGESLYAISKDICDPFDTCEPEASIEDITILAALQGGVNALSTGECEQARSILDDRIRKALLVTLIQGLLWFTVKANTDGNDVFLGHLYSYTSALLPYMETANADGANILRTNAGSGGTIDVSGAFDAIRNGISALGIECSEIGQIDVGGVVTGVCPSDKTPEVPVGAPVAPTSSPTLSPVFVPEKHPDGLAWGRYTFADNNLAEADANFTLDIRDIYFADTIEDANAIYSGPSQHAVNGLSGQPDIRSLKDMSTKASLFMKDNPVYNFFLAALFDDSTFDGNVTGVDGGWPYGDTVVTLAMGPENGNSPQLGAAAVIVMQMWMLITTRVYEAVRQCEKSINAPELIDSAVALWIGQEQGEGIFDSGWSMYAVSQDAAEFLNQDVGETKINTDLMQLFNDAQALAQTCSTEAEAASALRELADDIVRYLTIPLIQHLFFHMSDNNFEYVELYALAFIPQIIAVDEGTFEFLRETLFEGFDWDKSLNTELLTSFSKVLYALEIECDDLGDVSKASDNLEGLVDVICNDIDTTYKANLLAAYETTYDVSQLARIDLDIHQIDLFLRTNANNLALNVYENGRNSHKAGMNGFTTLKELATSKLSGPSDLHDLFKSFYEEDWYADDIIMAAFTEPDSGVFAGSSRRQISEAVRRTLQVMVMYLRIVSHLHTAIEVCKTNLDGLTDANGVPLTGQEYIDQAVALFVGSIEGPYSGGDLNQGGQMLYALGKEMCYYFGKCESHGDSETNVDILFALANVKENLDASNCDAAESIVEDNILSSLPVPLVQGILYFSDVNEGLPASATNLTLAAAGILTETLLPEIANVNETSAATIFDNMVFDLEVPAVRDGTETVFRAFASVLRGMNINCNDVGILQSSNFSVCDSSVAPVLDTPTNLGDNLYVSTTYVQDRANIALDVKTITDKLLMGRVQSARDIYQEGENSIIYDEQGKEIDLRSLASFSINASNTMKNNPLYQTAVFALQDDKGLYLGQEVWRYADTIVLEMFEAGEASREPLAAEAAVALNVWMELANELFNTVTDCKNKVLTNEDGIHSIDEAAAYWIGDGQVAGDAENGHLLYALAEKMGDNFNLNSGGQSRTNLNILRLFHQVKMEVSLSNGCTENAATARRVRRIVDQITSHMVVVLVQSLIHYLRADDEEERVRIYAHAFVPLVASCDPDAFVYLKEKLIDNVFREVEIEEIIVMIRSSLTCFDLTCDDIGIHTSEPTSECTDPSRLSPLASYRPANDVREYAQLDLDILEMSILMEMESYGAALELYAFGKHASDATGDGTALSLNYLATTPGRTIVPQFDSYKRYFKDDRYADTIVTKAFAQTDNKSAEERTAIAITSSQVLIVYMAALQAIYEAVNNCNESSSDRESAAAKSWDKAAALMIGQLEGSEESGSSEGMLLWSLSKRLCSEFGTCSEEVIGSSRTNDMISTLLYSGRGAILGGSCDELRKVANELAPLLQIPILQAALSSASSLALRLPKNRAVVQAQAHVYAQALLPLIHDVDRDAAKVIEENFPLDGEAMRSGIEAVVEAFARVIPKLGVSCEDVGSSQDVDSCSGHVGRSTKDKILIVVGTILCAVTAFAIFVLLRSKRKRLLPENSPNFITAKGELNHTSDLLARVDGEPSESAGETEMLKSDADGPLSSDEDDEDYVRAIETALVADQDKRTDIV